MADVICAWCKAVLGSKETAGGQVSHGICEDCLEKQKAELAELKRGKEKTMTSECLAPISLMDEILDRAREGRSDTRLVEIQDFTGVDQSAARLLAQALDRSEPLREIFEGDSASACVRLCCHPGPHGSRAAPVMKR